MKIVFKKEKIHETFIYNLLFIFELGYRGSPNTNTHIQFETTDKGIIIPRMDSSVRNAVVPNLNEESLLVYDKNVKQFMFWDGSEWSQIGNRDQYVFTDEQNVLMGTNVYFASDNLFVSGSIADDLPVNLRSSTIFLDSLTVEDGGELKVINEDCNE